MHAQKTLPSPSRRGRFARALPPPPRAAPAPFLRPPLATSPGCDAAPSGRPAAPGVPSPRGPKVGPGPKVGGPRGEFVTDRPVRGGAPAAPVRAVPGSTSVRCSKTSRFGRARPGGGGRRPRARPDPGTTRSPQKWPRFSTSSRPFRPHPASRGPERCCGLLLRFVTLSGYQLAAAAPTSSSEKVFVRFRRPLDLRRAEPKRGFGGASDRDLSAHRDLREHVLTSIETCTLNGEAIPSLCCERSRRTTAPSASALVSLACFLSSEQATSATSDPLKLPPDEGSVRLCLRKQTSRVGRHEASTGRG